MANFHFDTLVTCSCKSTDMNVDMLKKRSPSQEQHFQVCCSDCGEIVLDIITDCFANIQNINKKLSKKNRSSNYA